MVPQHYPRIDAATLNAWRSLSYAQLAGELMSLFADDYADDELGRLVRGVYTAAVFGSDEVAPLVDLEPGLKLLQLSNGPTLSFKDVALQLLGALFEHALAPQSSPLNILGATSGDTGASAEYAMRGRAIRVFMLSPDGRMSAFQRAQMYSLADANVFNIAVQGTFDDCQDIVKAIASDAGFKRRHRLGAVNSIQTGIAISNPAASYVTVNFDPTNLDGSSTGRDDVAIKTLPS